MAGSRGAATQEDFHDVVMMRAGVIGDVGQGVDGAKPGVDVGGAEPFQSFGEPVGDLPVVAEPVGAGGVQQRHRHHDGAAGRDHQQPGVVAVLGVVLVHPVGHPPQRHRVDRPQRRQAEPGQHRP